jgi:hypothetical protein
MHKNATKCNETLSKWCKNKHGASKIIDTFETYQPYLIEPPLREGPCNRYGAQFRCRRMRLRGKSLTCVATLDNVLGVMEGRKPVEPRSKSLGDEGLAAGIMPAGSFMNISKKCDFVLGCYAPLENPCGAALVEFSIDYRRGLGKPHDLSMMDGIF